MLPINTIRFGTDEFSFSSFLFYTATNVYNIQNGVLTSIGSMPITTTMFETYGMQDFAGVTKALLTSISGLNIAVYSGESTGMSINAVGTNKPVLLLSNGDIEISNSIANIDNFTCTSSVSGSGILRIIFSLDSGTTWNAYRNGAIVPITTSNLSNVKTNGLTIAELNAITSANWNSLLLSGNRKIRFGYYLEAVNSTDVINTDKLTMQVDMAGYWMPATLGTEYTFKYSTSTVLEVDLTSNGDFRITII